MAIPVLGRLSIREWPLLIFLLGLAWIEYMLLIVTVLLPAPLISLFTSTLKRLYSLSNDPVDDLADDGGIFATGKFKYLRLNSFNELDEDKYHLMIDLLNLTDFASMCQCFGYGVELHIVKTKDNYLLNIHRLSNDRCSTPRNGKVVYFHHGLLMSSEIWVTMLDHHLNLPFLLYDLGYDVWLGNNRGNKYSKKHLFYKTSSEQFWDFSLDEFAFFDIPNTIDYILDLTKVSSLIYIGFLQGTAQAFASISVNPDLNRKIEKMIAISPATTPQGLYSKVLDIMVKASPSVMYLIFSRKILMPSVILWQNLMYPPFYDTMIDLLNYWLFNWRSRNISKIQKLSSYAHLYSTTSVKCVVHWFQVISLKKFRMFTDFQGSQYETIEYPLKNIKVPIHVLYGDIDSLVDINVMLDQLPSHVSAEAIRDHEHLDNLWGSDVYNMVFKPVLRYLGETLQVALNEKTEKSYLQFNESFEDAETVSDKKTKVDEILYKPSRGQMFL